MSKSIFNLDAHDIAKKILGEIRPVGETNEDNRRFENLQVTIELVDALVFDISEVARDANRYEASIKKAGERAKSFLKDLESSLREDAL